MLSMLNWASIQRVFIVYLRRVYNFIYTERAKRKTVSFGDLEYLPKKQTDRQTDREGERERINDNILYVLCRIESWEFLYSKQDNKIIFMFLRSF